MINRHLNDAAIDIFIVKVGDYGPIAGHFVNKLPALLTEFHYLLHGSITRLVNKARALLAPMAFRGNTFSRLLSLPNGGNVGKIPCCIDLPGFSM